MSSEHFPCALLKVTLQLIDTASYHVLAGILVVVGIIRAYLGDALMAIGVFIDGFIFGLLVTFYIVYSSDVTMSEGMNFFR